MSNIAHAVYAYIFVAMFGVFPSGVSSRCRWRGVSSAADAGLERQNRPGRSASRETATTQCAAPPSKHEHQGLPASVQPAASAMKCEPPTREQIHIQVEEPDILRALVETVLEKGRKEGSL